MRYIKTLTPPKVERLKRIMKENNLQRVRSRAHAIILSSNKYSVEEISKIYEVDRDSVSSWLTRWETKGFEGLFDEARPGRPSKMFNDLKKN